MMPMGRLRQWGTARVVTVVLGCLLLLYGANTAVWLLSTESNASASSGSLLFHGVGLPLTRDGGATLEDYPHPRGA
jgi:hypothetical protein